MAAANFGIPDLESLGVGNNTSLGGEATSTYVGASNNHELSSESDTTEVYSSGDEMTDSIEELCGPFVLPEDDNIYINSEGQSIDLDFDIDTNFVEYGTGIQNDRNIDNEINMLQETANKLSEYESPVFSNLPNLPSEGLYGSPENTDLPLTEATESNLDLKSESVSLTNLPNFTEMDSSTPNNVAYEIDKANKECLVYSKDYMPKLEVLTERFESSFTLGSANNGPRACEKTRNNHKNIRKRARRQSKH